MKISSQVSHDWTETKNSPIIPWLKPWSFRWLKFPKQSFLEYFWSEDWSNVFENECKKNWIFYNEDSWKSLIFLIYDFARSKADFDSTRFKATPSVFIKYSDHIKDIGISIKIWTLKANISFLENWKYKISIIWYEDMSFSDVCFSQIFSSILQRKTIWEEIKKIFSIKNNILKSEIENIDFVLFPELLEKILDEYKKSKSNYKLQHVVFWNKLYELYNWVYKTDSILKPKDFEWYRLKPIWNEEIIEGFELLYLPNNIILTSIWNKCRFVLPSNKQISQQLKDQYLRFIDLMSIDENEKKILKLKLQHYFCQ